MSDFIKEIRLIISRKNDVAKAEILNCISLSAESLDVLRPILKEQKSIRKLAIFIDVICKTQ